MDLKNQKTPETLNWMAPSHMRQNRSIRWYLFFALVAISLIGFSVYTKSLLTGITFGLIIIVILIISETRPTPTAYKITKTGITVGQTVYPFKIIKKFWILYNPPEVKTLNLETFAYINNRVVMQLGKQDPVAVKLFLNKYLPEDLDKEESFFETLARRLKI